MTDSAILSMFGIVLLVCIAVLGIAHLPDAAALDVRWVTMGATLSIAVFAAYGAGWMWSIDRSLKVLNRILTDRDDMLHPELKGVVQLFLQRLREIWKWGVPK